MFYLMSTYIDWILCFLKAIQVRDCYLRCEECDEKDVKPDSHAAKETGLGSEIKTTDAGKNEIKWLCKVSFSME